MRTRTSLCELVCPRESPSTVQVDSTQEPRDQMDGPMDLGPMDHFERGLDQWMDLPNGWHRARSPSTARRRNFDAQFLHLTAPVFRSGPKHMNEFFKVLLRSRTLTFGVYCQRSSAFRLLECLCWMLRRAIICGRLGLARLRGFQAASGYGVACLLDSCCCNALNVTLHLPIGFASVVKPYSPMTRAPTPLDAS